MYYELIYENGDVSIMAADSDDEALEGISAAHKRAMEGKRSLQSDPNSPPASRVKRVFVYKEHPGNYGEDGLVDVKEATAALEEYTKDGKVDVANLALVMRNLSSATVMNAEPHESKYQMKADREIKSDKWEAASV